MTAYPIKIGVRVAVAGELDIATSGRLTAALEQALGQGPQALVIDLAGVTFMASSGVSVLLNAYRKSAAAGIPLTVVNCGRAVERILEITGVYKVLTGGEPPAR